MIDRTEIIVVTGIQGAGKSTIGRLLAERFERSACIDADDVAAMIVSGQSWVTDTSGPGEGLTEESTRQLRLRLKNACLLGRSYYEAGFTAVIIDIVIGERFDHLREDLAGVPFYLVVLAPNADVVIEREAARGKKTLLGPKWAHYLDGELRGTMTGVGLWVDSSEQTAEETVDEVVRRIWDEGLVES